MYKKKSKVIICAMLIAAMLFSLTACGGQSGGDYDLEAQLTQTAEVLISSNEEPVYGSIGGEWLVFGMSRWGGEVPENWYEDYYKNVEDYVKACDGKLDEHKYTEYSRTVIALTSIGKDPADVAGYNLLEPLADYEKTVFQGVNGAVYALLALDCANYEIPAVKGDGTQATREMYVDCILDSECAEGGWSFAGGPAEVDMTATVLQALAKYQSREDVAAAIDRALTVMSERQNDNGGYAEYDMLSSEVVSQVIVALTELGISIDDSRFVKSGNTLLDCLMTFAADDGGFKHVIDGESNQLATEQAFYAMVALHLAEQGMPSLYSVAVTEEKETSAEEIADMTCIITVDGFCTSKSVEIVDGSTVYDALKATGVDVSARSTGYGLYIEGIDGRFEFDEGPTSGWVYTVNGERTSFSCDKFEVKAGDEIIWSYVDEL